MAYETQHLRSTPAGYHVRTVKAGTHLVRVAFPPGPRRTGKGVPVEVLHPQGENPVCSARTNPMELLVMGANPIRGNPRGSRIPWKFKIHGGKAIYKAFSDPSDAEKFRRELSQRYGKAVSATRRGDSIDHERRALGNPMDNFTPAEKMYLGQLGFKWSEIKTDADVRRARKALTEYCALKGRCAVRRSNPQSIVMGGEPSEIAAEIYAGFHADEADKTIRTPEPHMPSGDYAQIGTLYALAIKPMPAAGDRAVKAFMPTGSQPIRVVSDTSRRRIYFSGGDQSLSADDLRAFGADESNICRIGDARYITYLARKYHAEVDAKDRGKVVEWVHRFGEGGGELPAVFYDRAMKRILLQGGSYEVQNEGIVN